jgi:glycosyltransferase involved in cell wall biosynthesis/ubiquinone/menaquinone biosynthesis C-methylase UbiE
MVGREEASIWDVSGKMSGKGNRKGLSLPTPEHPMPFTGERYTPGVQGGIEHEHLHRYLFALQLCKGKDVLDVASGEGYGSALLAQVARTVVGIDIDAQSVRFANQTYIYHNLSYKSGSATQIPIMDASMDVIVSFETIEHFAEHEDFLREIKRVLKPDGLLVMSSPDRDVYSKEGPTQNPFHAKELNKVEFHRLVKAYFTHAEFGCQKAAAGSLILPQTNDGTIRVEVFDRGPSAQFEQSAGLQKAVYLLAIASDSALPVIRWGAYQDTSYIGRLVNDLDAKRAEVNQLVSGLDAKTAEVNRFAAELEKKVAETARLSDTLSAAMTAAGEQQAAQAAEANSLRHQLEQAQRESASARQSLSKMKRSFSWRATRPLRAIVKEAKRVTKAKRQSRRLAFDAAWYLKRYPDVAAASIDPLRHYLDYGRDEGRVGTPPRADHKVVDNGPILVVLLTDPVDRLLLSEELWPCIRIADPGSYSPAPSDYVYEPSATGACLSSNHLHNVFLCLAAGKYDFVLVSHGIDALPMVRVPSRTNNLIVRSNLLPSLRGGHALPSGVGGRVLRLVPPPEAVEINALSISDITGAACKTAGAEVQVGAKRGESVRTSNVGMLRSIRGAACERDLRTVLVLPAFFAVGGVERNTIEIMRKLQDRYRFVVATSEPHDKARGSLHHQLTGLASGVFDLWEIAQPEQHLELLTGLDQIYGIDLIWICNGSPWLLNHASELREAFPMVPIVDQQAYDTEEGWIAHFWNPGIRSFDRFIAINSRIRETFIDHYRIEPSRIGLIYSVIDAQRFVCREQTGEAAERWGRQVIGDISDTKLFAMIGRLTPQKRPLDFLELALRSKRDGARDIFVLIGDGELASECRLFREQHQLENVRFVDFCEDLRHVYPLLSGLIVTSQYEGLPIVALEAMAMGVPVLATDVGDLRLVFSQHGVGNLFGAIGNPDLQYGDFSTWRNDLERAKALASAAADAVRERFSSARIAAEYDACWSKAIVEKASSRGAVCLSIGGTRMNGLSVVIPTHNRKDLLMQTLQRCREAAKGVDTEFVVVDDGSTDGTADSLRLLAKRMPALRWQSVNNRGPGQARNIGAAMASKDIVMFLGDDIQPSNDRFFSIHAQLHENRPEDTFAVLGKIVWPNRPDLPVNFVMGHIQGRGAEQFGYAHLMPYTFVDWRHFYTSNVSVKRSVVMNWVDDGFSNEFTLYGYEDTEFAYRMFKTRGEFKIYYDPTSLGAHCHSYSAEAFINRQISAGMMAHVFHRLHPEVASSIGIGGLLREIERPGGRETDATIADYLSVIEGIKSYVRISERRADFGGSYWHDDLLSAVFELAYGQGFVMAASMPGANLGAAYEFIVNQFFERISGVVRREVTGTALLAGDSLPNAHSRSRGKRGLARAIRGAIRRLNHPRVLRH